MTPFPANVPPAEATAFLRNKLALPTETWTDIWGAAHARAFVVAGANTEAIVTDFQIAVTKAIEEGQTLEQFRGNFDAIVEKHGWSHSGSRGWRSRVIYETNTRMAYMAAKWKAFVDNRLKRPFLRYVGVLDDRIRPQHRQWHDTVLPVEHPWWRQHFPPNGWGCRCDVQSLSEKDLARRGLRVQPEAPPVVLVTRQVRSARGTGFVTVPKGIDPGFDHNVGVAAFSPPSQRGQPFTALSSPVQTPAPSNLVAVPAQAKPAEAVADEAAARHLLREVIGGDTATLTDPAGIMVQIGQAIIDHLVETKDEANIRRAIYLPLLPELIREPQEIWVGFATNDVTGRVELRRRYVRCVTLRGGKLLSLVTDAKGRELVGLTFFVGGKPTDARMRTGLLVYPPR